MSVLEGKSHFRCSSLTFFLDFTSLGSSSSSSTVIVVVNSATEAATVVVVLTVNLVIVIKICLRNVACIFKKNYKRVYQSFM